MKLTFTIFVIVLSCVLYAQPVPYKQASTTITLQTNEFLYNPYTDRIYAVVSSEDPNFPNSLSIINPVTSTIENTFILDAPATTMAISNDGEYIYLGFLDLPVVKRFSISTESFDMEFNIGYDTTHPYYALDIDVVPGQNNVIAVVRSDEDGNPDDVAIFDSGQMRPLTSGYMESLVKKVLFSNSNTLYTRCLSCFPAPIRTYNLTEQGITLVHTTESTVPTGDSTIKLSYNDNKLYSSSGKIVDLLPSPHESGAIDISEGSVVYDTSNDLICAAYYSIYPYADPNTGYYDWQWHVRIDSFNPDNYQIQNTFFIESSSQVNKIITCGNGCYAIGTSFWVGNDFMEKIYIVRENTLSVHNPDEYEDLVLIYPNPSSDFININTNADTMLKSAVLYDSNGRIILDVQLTANTIDIRNISQGLYLVKLTDENDNIYTEKIIKR